jgi:diacylglycerol kinase (ATP)
MSHLGHLVHATRNSWRGLVAIAKSEKAFQQELVALAIGIPLAFVIAADNWKRIALIAVLVLLLIVELLNTGLEKLSDVVTREHHPGIGWVKDMGSAAVGLSLLLAGLVWLVALAEWLGLIG